MNKKLSINDYFTSLLCSFPVRRVFSVGNLCVELKDPLINPALTLKYREIVTPASLYKFDTLSSEETIGFRIRIRNWKFSCHTKRQTIQIVTFRMGFMQIIIACVAMLHWAPESVIRLIVFSSPSWAYFPFDDDCRLKSLIQFWVMTQLWKLRNIFRELSNIPKQIYDPKFTRGKINANSFMVFHSFAGLFLECPGVTSVLLKTNLQHIQAPIQSLSIYDFDRTITALTNDLFASSSPNGLQIKHLQFSNSNIQMLKDNSLINLRDSLESLSIVNGKLTNVSKYSGCHR